MSNTTREQLALQNALRSRIENLRIRYPRYSIRAFAKKAGISPATLSLLLQGKRRVSHKLANQLSDRLFFDPQERAAIFNSFLSRKKKTVGQVQGPEYVQLSIDQYRLISDWRAFALLSLIKTKGFRNDKTWISERLGITPQEASETLQQLKRLEMISESGGKLTRTATKYRTTEDIANLSLRKSHQQTLDLAASSLENDPVERRDFSWITLALDAAKLPEAKTLIRKFQDDLMALMEEDPEPTEVYRLAVQLFPLTKSSSKNQTRETP